MSNGQQNDEMEHLLEFLYIAPVALIEFDDSGKVVMANPRVAQLFNRFAPGGYFENFFTFLGDNLVELKDLIQGFDQERGQIMENKRFRMEVPSGADSFEELWFDATVMRQDKKRYIASLNNVTDQVRTQVENHMRGQALESIYRHVDDHIMFTLNSDGVVDSWNITGEYAMGILPTNAINRSLQDIVKLVEDEPLDNLLLPAREKGWFTTKTKYNNAEGRDVGADLTVWAINDLSGGVAGYSAILSHHH